MIFKYFLIILSNIIYILGTMMLRNLLELTFPQPSLRYKSYKIKYLLFSRSKTVPVKRKVRGEYLWENTQ